MREIKFRAWDKRNKRMWWNVQNAYDTLGNHQKEDKDYNGYDTNDREDFDPCSFGSVIEDDDYIIQQFTGLKDKNGKEIYEGDIIINVWGYFDVPFLVVWDLYGFRLKCLKQFYYIDKDQYMDCPTHIEMTEVIGNIYQNPELLN